MHYYLWLLLVFIYLGIRLINSCGTSTHISIAHEALTFWNNDNDVSHIDFKKILIDNQDAFLAGNPYPDAMYPSLCFGGEYHQIAEDTHWAPFLNASINYIRSLPTPWDKETEKLVAFVFGFVSHQIADVTWHSLGIEQGFLQTMGKINFHGSFPAAHIVGDVGGDMISQYQDDDGPIGYAEWYVPVKDLQKIYQLYYGETKISDTVIQMCSSLLYLEWIGEKLAGEKLYSYYSKESSFLLDQLHNYFLGGIHDMSSWSQILWNKTVEMIEDGTDSCVIPHSPLGITCNNSVNIQNENKRLRNPGRSHLLNLFGHSVDDLNINVTERGIIISPGESLINKLDMFKLEKMKRAKENLLTAEYKDDISPYAEMGSVVIPINENKDIAVGIPNYGSENAPQNGRVLILVKDGTSASVSKIIKGDEPGAKFGQSISMIDYNCDGIEDIAIGSPSAGANNLSYHGTVKIYLAKRLPLSFNKYPDVVIHGLNQYENFGYLIKSMDINQDGFKDLIVSSPLMSDQHGEQRGSVKVFLSKNKMFDSTINLTSSDADIVINGTQDYEWFGTDFVFYNWKGKVFLLIGAPCNRICYFKNCSFSEFDKQEMGMVYIYEISKDDLNVELIHTIKGNGGRFGSCLSIGEFYSDREPMFAASAPTQNVKGHLIDLIPTIFEQAGEVYILDLMQILTHSEMVIYVEDVIVASLQGDRSLGHFGYSIDFILSANLSKSTQDLVVGSPYWTKDFTHEITGAEQGAVYVFQSGFEFPKGSFTNDCGFALISPCPSKYAGQFFEGNEDYARFGHSFAVYHHKNRNYLAIGAPRSNRNHFHGGNLLLEPLM